MKPMEVHGGVKRPNERNGSSYFYKIIVSPSIQTYKLRIPEKYVKTDYEEQLAKDYVKLRVNDGRFWRVELFKESDKVWLTKGWECFARSYSLSYGYFLLFGYDTGDSELHVSIFDTSCCETAYDQVYDNHCINTEEMKEISSQDEEINEDDDDNGIITSQEENVAVDDITLEDFPSQNPKFKVVMSHRIINGKSKLPIPFDYALKHMKGKHLENFILKGAYDEKSYVVRFYFYANKYRNASFYQWHHFVRDYGLMIGDTCVFELVDHRSNTYKVTIFRARRS